MAQAEARHPEFPGRCFNVGFVLEPDGQVALRHQPHNVFDRWVELYGATLDAFYPVADTEIGRLGIMMANEGLTPEDETPIDTFGGLSLIAEHLGRVVGEHAYPKNLYAEHAPYDHETYRREVLEPQVRALQERGVYAAPEPGRGDGA